VRISQNGESRIGSNGHGALYYLRNAWILEPCLTQISGAEISFFLALLCGESSSFGDFLLRNIILCTIFLLSKNSKKSSRKSPFFYTLFKQIARI